ncbi:MAG TPA: sodium:proton antiporter [Acidobacteriota bacterium]|nr:sodium:proton antiporter [Acidobacteriota bacterium]HQG93160.1 sodium:proton antiporter [Acidobacteriota bacterium]
MKKITLFSTLLVAGLVGSQLLPAWLGSAYAAVAEAVRFLTMFGLAFIMIHVGYEFELDQSQVRSLGKDYGVAMTTAAFPWIIAALYFMYLLLPAAEWGNWTTWKELILAGRFAAPTATGILFSMMAAAGLSATWTFRKTRILAIFDDLDTVLLMIPLKMLMIGLAWQLGFIVVVMAVLLAVGWRWLHRLRLPVSWPWVLGYAFAIAAASEFIYQFTKLIDDNVPVHIEVLLPAFVLGCVIQRPAGCNPHCDDAREGHQEGPESPVEQRVSTIVSAVFMVLVGLSMPVFIGSAALAPAGGAATVTAAQPPLSPGTLVVHVVVLTLLINIGKLFPAFCYRREAHWRERLAVAVGMCPRGEVGAGIILLSLSYGIGGPVVAVAVLSLALNLVLTPVFVAAVNHLVRTTPPVRV